jgi:hypothetical protein
VPAFASDALDKPVEVTVDCLTTSQAFNTAHRI